MADRTQGEIEMTRTAPFTPEEVVSLNAFQKSGAFHPFTCGNDSGHPDLIATTAGWVCSACDYRQTWAHSFMTNADWITSVCSAQESLTAKARDDLGRVVRAAWIRWAKTQPEPKASWLAPYDELSEPDKEADRMIAEAVLGDINARRIFLAVKKSRELLSDAESAEFDALQEGFFASLNVKFPRPPIDTARLDAIEQRLGLGGP